MAKSLTPEQLGEEGETAFASLCNRADLSANKSTKDVFGWDYVVESLDDKSPSSIPLDKRPKFTARVQVKASAAPHSAAVLSLSAAGRLARDAMPAFVVYFRLTQDGTPIRGHLIHLIDDNLSRILKRLRLAHARDKTDLNKQTISFDPTARGVVFELTPDGLRAALEEAWGPDPTAYVERKTTQLRELGYEDGGLTGNLLLAIEDENHFSRIITGLEPVRPEAWEFFDVRFGIALPHEAADLIAEQDIYLTPTVTDTCRLTVRRPGLAPPAIFDMDVSFPWAQAGIRDSTMLLSHNDFHMKITGEAGLDFETKDILNSKRSLADWIVILNLLVSLTGPCRLIFEFGHMGSFSLPIAETSPMSGSYVAQLPTILEFLRGYARLAELGGIDVTTPFAFEEIWDGYAASLAVEWTKPQSAARFEWNMDSFHQDGPTPQVGLIYFAFEFLAQRVFVAARTWIEPASQGLVSSRFELVDVRPEDGDLEEYATAIASLQGLQKLADIGELLKAGRHD